MRKERERNPSAMFLYTVFCQLRVPPLIRAPLYSLEEAKAIINGQN